jgi:hypothetical protein
MDPTEHDPAREAADDFKELAPMGNSPVAPAHVVASIALNMAMKYHDMSIVKDGALYQQYKLEGRNIRTIGLDDIFADAVRIEAWLLGSSDRIAKLIVDAINDGPEGDESSGDSTPSAEG